MSFDKSNTPSNDRDSTSVSTRGISLKTKTLTAIGALMILIIGCADALEFWQLRQEGAAQLATRASLVVAVQADAWRSRCGISPTSRSSGCWAR